jgi:hypothetical protein
VLGHFVLADDLAYGDADAVFAAQRIALALDGRLDAGEFFPGSAHEREKIVR